MAGNRQHIVMVASENDALIGGKVGGVGDVIRSLPNALAKLGCDVTVIIPSYGFLHKNNPSKILRKTSFPFAGKQYEGTFYSVQPKAEQESVSHILFEHPELRGDPIYFNDPPDSPFERDARKYALFCSAVGKFLATMDIPFVLHLHDWHCGVMFLLRELHPEFSRLKNIRTVFTIHNLAIQGTRPISGSKSSLKSWFPELFKNNAFVPRWKDDRYDEPCFTPMAVGIRCADKVNTVSATYAEEILKPNDPKNGDHGGEGLETFLHEAKKEKRLSGILNGCEYPNSQVVQSMSFSDLCNLTIQQIHLVGEKSAVDGASKLIQRIEQFKMNPPSMMLTSVTRVVEQKIGLLFTQCKNGATAFDELMKSLARWNGMYFFLGNGTPDYEALLEKMAVKYERLIFVKAYAEKLSQALYANGSLFVMPSLFEPCGISQMLAMREGQPCLVNSVGGLRDTVMNGVNGFAFYGSTMRERADALVESGQRAMEIYSGNKPLWEKIRIGASKTRFSWERSARQYIDLLYS